MSISLHNDWKGYKARVMHQGAPAPNPNEFYVGIANTSVLTNNSTKASFITEELPHNLFQRRQIIWTGNGSYDAGQKQYELPSVTVTLAANAGDVAFQTLFLLANARATSSVSFDGAQIDPANNLITMSNTLTEEEEILLRPRVGASLAGTGLTPGTIYTAMDVTSNSFRVSSNLGISAIDITAAGSGTIDLCYARGTLVFVDVQASPQTILNGQSMTYTIDLAEANITYGSGT